ncbi:UNVERIFIED_CONTAM: DNA mismatch repair protein MSH3 [Sesamum radiatum]|uniref:DNA mismatch repair protein MSH3 n=1 Tax=Sesamum radiatum TaxID=300843 RepID=A0AAW2KBV9_SESRA
MGKQKQEVISRFFAPKPKNSTTIAGPSQPQNPPTPPPKIATTVSFSPAKRVRTTELNSRHDKLPKLTPPTPTANSILPLPNPHLHQKFLEKLLEPPHELLEPSRNKSSTQIRNPKYTPLEQQVVELKERYPDVLLMIEVGYKYRFFGEDAENAARVLGIYAHMDHNFLTASVPTFRLHVHVRRLVSAGYKVGVVKQTETAAIKAHGTNRMGPFCRGLSALYTKATLEAAEDLGGGEERCGSCSNYLFCVVEKMVGNMESGVDVKIGAVAVEISTGDVVYGEFDDNFMRAGLEAMLLNLAPAELLLGRPLSKQTEKFGPFIKLKGSRNKKHINETRVCAYDECSGLDRRPKEHQCFACGLRWTCIKCPSEYASQDRFHDGGALAEVISLYEELNENNLPNGQQEKVIASAQGNNSLAFKVLKNNSDGSENGSLLQCMNHTLTVFGSRLLRHWVTHPLCDRKIHHLISSVLISLGRAPDVQRGITRIFHRTATASEMLLPPVQMLSAAILVAGRQLRQLHIEEDENKSPQVRTVRSVLLRKLILTTSSSSVISTAARLLSMLNKEAADQRDLHNLFIISDGNFPEVASARTKVHLANERLYQLLPLYRKQLRISNLEFMSVSGVTHLIELPVDVKVPPDWVKSAVQALATLDCLYSLAMVSRTKNYVRPVFVSDNEPAEINISCGRHPVMEDILQNDFVPNDTNLHADGQYCQIVTGPNMGGKSCYIRQVALIALMAQVGCFVPASSVKLHVLDGIYTRMGASDSIQLGKSTFLEELSEASHILQHCTSRSLVIIDELGRGTSKHDGVAIAYATLHYLLEHKRCIVLFVTHYPEIVDIRNDFPGSIGAYHVSYLTPQKETDLNFKADHEMDTVNHDDVTYLYKLVPGVSERSFGFKVAQLAQLPSSCIRRAVAMAARLEAEVCKREKMKSLMNCAMPNDKSENAKEDAYIPVDCLRTAGTQNLEEVEKPYQDLFFHLNLAFHEEEDAAKRLCNLKFAKSLAGKLLNR